MDADAGLQPALASGDAARLLGVSNQTIVNWLDAGVLSGYSVPGPSRSRHFVFLESARQLQRGGPRRQPTGATPAVSDIAKERDLWRARAAQAESTAALLREALVEVLAAHDDQARAADHLRRALQIQEQALATYTVDVELMR